MATSIRRIGKGHDPAIAQGERQGVAHIKEHNPDILVFEKVKGRDGGFTAIDIPAAHLMAAIQRDNGKLTAPKFIRAMQGVFNRVQTEHNYRLKVTDTVPAPQTHSSSQLMILIL